MYVATKAVIIHRLAGALAKEMINNGATEIGILAYRTLHTLSGVVLPIELSSNNRSNTVYTYMYIANVSARVFVFNEIITINIIIALVCV